MQLLTTYILPYLDALNSEQFSMKSQKSPSLMNGPLVFLATAREVVLLSGSKVKRPAKNFVNSGDQLLDHCRWLFFDFSKMTIAEETEVFWLISKGRAPPLFNSKAVTPKDHQSTAKL